MKCIIITICIFVVVVGLCTYVSFAADPDSTLEDVIRHVRALDARVTKLEIEVKELQYHLMQSSEISDYPGPYFLPTNEANIRKEAKMYKKWLAEQELKAGREERRENLKQQRAERREELKQNRKSRFKRHEEFRQFQQYESIRQKR